jgi:parallel beta-helix repeat protein
MLAPDWEDGMKLAIAALAALVMMGSLEAEARAWRVRPGPNAQNELQAALSGARPGDEVRLDEGRFDLSAGLTLSVDRVTVRGDGQDKSILSGAGLTVVADGVELRDFAVENARGDAVKVMDCTGATLRGVRAEWSGASQGAGGNGLAAVNCANVLIQGVVARGAARAGVYVSQSRAIIVRDSSAERSVVGFAIENSWNADLFDNSAARNGVGVLVADLPEPPQQNGHSTRVFRNQLLSNDAANVPPDSPLAAAIPTGTGVLIMGGRDVHVFENQIGENGGANVIIIAFRGPIRDAAYTPLPRDVMIRDNQFGRTGFAPGGELAALAQAGVRLPDVLWDGADTYIAGGVPRSLPPRIVVRDNRSGRGPGSFLSLGIPVAGGDFSEAAPSNAFPPLLDIPEPERVRIE